MTGSPIFQVNFTNGKNPAKTNYNMLKFSVCINKYVKFSRQLMAKFSFCIYTE